MSRLCERKMQFSLPLILTLQSRRSLTARDLWESACQCVKGLRRNCSDVSRTVLALPCPSGGINLVLLPRSRSLKCGREDGHRTQKWRNLRFGSAISIGWTMPTWASFPSWRLASARPSCCLRLVLGGELLSSGTMAICTWYLPAHFPEKLMDGQAHPFAGTYLLDFRLPPWCAGRFHGEF